MLEFTVGINFAGRHESVTVAAEDALIAALKVKCERPDALINYLRRVSSTCSRRFMSASTVIPDRFGFGIVISGAKTV